MHAIVLLLEKNWFRQEVMKLKVLSILYLVFFFCNEPRTEEIYHFLIFQITFTVLIKFFFLSYSVLLSNVFIIRNGGNLIYWCKFIAFLNKKKGEFKLHFVNDCHFSWEIVCMLNQFFYIRIFVHFYQYGKITLNFYWRRNS